METSQSLIGAYLLNGQGGATRLDWKEVKSWDPGKGVLWAHLDRKSSKVKSWLREESGLELVICSALLAEETRPRTQVFGDGMLVILRGVNLNPGSEPDDMISVRMWIDAKRLISLRAPKLQAIQDVRETLETGKGPRNTGEILVGIAHQLSERMSPVLSNLSDLIDGVEETILESVDPGVRRDLSRIRSQAITLRRYIAPQRDAIGTILLHAPPWFSQEDKALLRECNDKITRYIEDLDALRERASVVQEEISNRMAEQMNRTMYVLSLVAGIFLPLGLLTGLLGINVGGMPGVDSPFAFWIVCGLLLVLTGIGLWMFRRLKFF